MASTRQFQFHETSFPYDLTSFRRAEDAQLIRHMPGH